MKHIILRSLKKCLNRFFIFIETILKIFITYHTRPKYTDSIKYKTFYYNNIDFQTLAIVMQGPLILKDNFTIETLKLYRNFFPTVKIILSTWDTEDEEYVNKVRKLNIIVLQNKKPALAGIANINLQIASSTTGINHAKKLGCKYVLKTRTDQRIYSDHFLQFIYASLKKFPLTHRSAQKERIIAFNLNTFMFRPYSVSDMINFGHVDDMIKYWCLEYDTRGLEDLPVSNTLIGWSKQRLAEVYFVTSF